MINLSGRIAIVTGASRGIGRATAKMLAAAGAEVVAAAREEHARATVDEITAAGGRAYVASVEVSDRDSVDRLVAGALERSGRIDILVSNAGIARDQLMLRMKREDWDAVIATNLTALFSCTQAVLKTMVRQRSGRIIAIGSIVGQAGNPGQVNYAASKAGIIGFSKALALEVASRGITVNVVSPGLIDTDMTRAISEDAHDTWASRIPLGRLGSPDDVASAVCFLASDAASYITGQVLAVNGGMYM
jgi:3-oxoacyl-[acyl-carrier protein] reductase